MKLRCMFNNTGHDLDDEDDSATIAQLKERLARAVGGDQLTPSNQKWIYKGKVLLDESTLVSSGFTAGDTVHVILSTAATSTAAAQSPAPSYFPVPQFDHAMRTYLSMHSSPVEISPSLSTIHKIISNIIKNPHEEKYRKIKSSNSLIQKKIVSIPGALNVLLATGFASTAGGEEYAIMVSPTAWEVLVACQRKLEVFLKKLEEPTVDPSAKTSATTTSSPPPPPVAPSPVATPSTFSSGTGVSVSEQAQQQAMQHFFLALAATATTNASTSTSTSSTEVGNYSSININSTLHAQLSIMGSVHLIP